MSVRTFENAAALVALALLSAPLAARAEGAGFRHERSIYLDDKEGALRSPEGVACDDKGSFVVADTGNGRILTYTWKDGSLRGGTPFKAAQLSYPVRVQIDSRGNVLVLDRKARRIGRVDARNGFAGWVEPKGASNQSAIIPVAFKLDAADSVYVLDVAGRRVLVLDARDNLTREVALPRSGVFTDVAVDAAGRIYAVDAVAAAVWAVDKGGSAFQDLTKSLKDRMNFPGSITASRGKLYVVDQNGNGVVVLGQDGSYQGRELSIGWTDGLLYYPAQLCMNERGDAFVADRNNNRVQIFATAK